MLFPFNIADGSGFTEVYFIKFMSEAILLMELLMKCLSVRAGTLISTLTAALPD